MRFVSSKKTKQVATRPAENPVNVVARKFNFGQSGKDAAPKLPLPGKLVFPSLYHTGHFSMLGLGDIVSNYSIPIVIIRNFFFSPNTSFK